LRPLNGRPELRVAVWLQRLQARVCGLSLQPMSCTGAALVCDVQRRCSCRLWRYISVMSLPLHLLNSMPYIVSKHSVKCSHMSCVSREIRTGQCCCTVLTTLRCHCHSLHCRTGMPIVGGDADNSRPLRTPCEIFCLAVLEIGAFIFEGIFITLQCTTYNSVSVPLNT